jgi:hypothetical protein
VANGHKDTNIILLSFRLPQEQLNKWKDLTPNLKVVSMKGEDQVHETAIERFRIAAELGKEYDAICLMEADIFLTANVDIFFRVAAAGFVVTASNGMIVNFGKDYQKQYKIDLGVDKYIYPKVHTTVPIFLGPKDLDWFQEFYDMRLSAKSFDDVFGLNILGIKKGIDKRMICLSPYQFTGIHHFGVKPETGWMDKEGLFLSGTEEQVYSVHGKWWDKGWRDDLMKVMKGYFKYSDMGPACVRKTQQSIRAGYNKFLEYNKE